MNRFALSSYQTAESRMRSNGHIFDVGQIAPIVLSQLYEGVHLGLITVKRDSWPLRGLTLTPEVPVRTVFELVDKRPLSPAWSHRTLWHAAFGHQMATESPTDERSSLLSDAAKEGFTKGATFILEHLTHPITDVGVWMPGDPVMGLSSLCKMEAEHGRPFVHLSYLDEDGDDAQVVANDNVALV